MHETERNAIALELAKLAETIKEAYAANDSAQYISAFDDDAIVSMPNSLPVRGHDALRTVFENRPALPPGARRHCHT